MLAFQARTQDQFKQLNNRVNSLAKEQAEIKRTLANLVKWAEKWDDKMDEEKKKKEGDDLVVKKEDTPF